MIQLRSHLAIPGLARQAIFRKAGLTVNLLIIFGLVAVVMAQDKTQQGPAQSAPGGNNRPNRRQRKRLGRR